jgi:hypothetical protein
MPITLNHSNISVQYSSDKSYIIETVKSDLYRRNESYDSIVRDNLQTAPVTPSIYIENGTNNVYAVEAYLYGGSENTADFTRVFPKNTTGDILIVGGGGGGGSTHGGGGGAGQLVFIHQANLNGTYNIKVGKGGIGGSINATSQPTKGSNSEFGSVIAEGGGANGGNLLKDGGSGAGGDGYDNVSGKGLKNTTIDTFLSGTIYSKGNDGGSGPSSGIGHGGGGGGAGTAGTDGGIGQTTTGLTITGNGGDGLSGISEINYDFYTKFGNYGNLESDGKYYFAGGGGGAAWGNVSGTYTPNGGNGGKGGGSKGGIFDEPTITYNPLPAVNNTGSGGGGGAPGGGAGSNGGSGIVIIRYLLGTIPTNNLLTSEPTITSSPSFPNNIRTFMHSGGSETQTSHTINFPANTLCDILVIAGGGGGGKRHGAGGGAGTLLYHKNVILNGTYNIKVGKGGAGFGSGTLDSVVSSNRKAFDGEFSQFVKSDGTQNYYAVGGGRGTTGGDTYANTNGGQGFMYDANLTLSSGNIFNGVPVAVSNKEYVNTLPSPEGCRGRIGGTQINNYKGGGGGGAGGVGMNHAEETTVNDGYGGLGLAIDITGTSVVYAGGGGGSDFSGSVSQVFDPAYPTIQSRGGGGYGSDNGTAQNGLDGTGGGGGGQGNDNNGNPAGNGGSGIVIIKIKSFANTAILDGVTHKVLNFLNILPLKYDFTNYNTEATWKAYAATIPNFTYFFDNWFRADFFPNSIYAGNFDVGWFQMTLPSGYNYVSVFYGSGGWSGGSSVRLLINGVEKSSVINATNNVENTTTYSQAYTAGDILRVEETYANLTSDIIITLTNTNPITYTVNFLVPTIADINNNTNIVLRGEYDIVLSTTNSAIIPKSNQYIPKITNYGIERMYPPVRNFTAATTVVSGQTHGNGTYVVSYSSSAYTGLEPWTCFNTSVTNGGHWGESRYNTSGVFNSTSFIVSGYLGDWVKIQLPVAIKLTRFGFLRRIGLLDRAPKDFKIYGSNDNITWVELVNKTDAVYNASSIYEQITPNITNAYTYYGLVVNKIFIGASGNTLNFDEWYIYGQEPLTNSLSIRYNLLNPILDPIGAQWTYSSNNTNVYHMGSVGIGTKSPEYQLDVRGFIFTSAGGYTQTGSENWVVQSDRRIKENIVRASYEKCLDNVKKIELYNFNFKDNCVNTNDKNQLGFIAQEVQQVYPKAVEVGRMTLDNNQGINDLLTLNTTQIKYTLYGAVKNLIERVENIESRVEQIYNMTLSSNIKSSSSNISITFITPLTSNITTNTSNITANTSNITTNTSNITTNTSNITTNSSNITANTSNITTNTSNITANSSNITTNTSNI